MEKTGEAGAGCVTGRAGRGTFELECDEIRDE
jgi:hypothetical protein